MEPLDIKESWYFIPNTPYKHARAFFRFLEKQGENVLFQEDGNYWHIYILTSGLENFME